MRASTVLTGLAVAAALCGNTTPTVPTAATASTAIATAPSVTAGVTASVAATAAPPTPAATVTTPVLGVAPTLAGCPMFPADNIWNAPVDALPLHVYSDDYVETIGPAAIKFVTVLFPMVEKAR